MLVGGLVFGADVCAGGVSAGRVAVAFGAGEVCAIAFSAPNNMQPDSSAS